MTRPYWLRLRYWLWRLLHGLVALVLAVGVARADDTVLVSLVSEATYREEDHAAILWTMQRRARQRGVSLSEQLRSYCAVWKRPKIPKRVLDALSRPERVRGVLRTIRRFERGELPDPCRGRTNHFGAPYGVDIENARSWRRVSCGSTANVFYVGP